MFDQFQRKNRSKWSPTCNWSLILLSLRPFYRFTMLHFQRLSFNWGAQQYYFPPKPACTSIDRAWLDNRQLVQLGKWVNRQRGIKWVRGTRWLTPCKKRLYPTFIISETFQCFKPGKVDVDNASAETVEEI